MRTPGEIHCRQNGPHIERANHCGKAPESVKPAERFKPGDAVVCLGDGKHDTLPNSNQSATDRICPGRVARVSGVSDGGNQVWVYDPDAATGEEYEFHSSLICPLDQFRAKFPKTVRAILAGSKKTDCRTREPDFHTKPVGNSKIAGVIEPRPLIDCGLAFLEKNYERQDLLDEIIYQPSAAGDKATWGTKLNQDATMRHVASELSALFGNYPKYSALAVQSRLGWQLLRRGEKLMIFCGSLNPVTAMLFQIGQTGRLNCMARIISGRMEESDFRIFVASAGWVLEYSLRICDAREPDVFFQALAGARLDFDYALCDWRLSAREKAEAYRISRNSQIRFLCPN